MGGLAGCVSALHPQPARPPMWNCMTDIRHRFLPRNLISRMNDVNAYTINLYIIMSSSPNNLSFHTQLHAFPEIHTISHEWSFRSGIRLADPRSAGPLMQNRMTDIHQGFSLRIVTCPLNVHAYQHH
jgi:hypothetical protein